MADPHDVMARYVIITPAHNEEAFIEKTMQSVISQTVLPLRWVVVNDGSTDGTRRIIERFRADHLFIELINVARPEGRHFANKVRAFNAALAHVQHLEYEYIGNLDADISIGTDYFERVLLELGRDPTLGVAGGMVSSSIRGVFVSQNVALDSVAGAVQLFRRGCFEQIGGYLALPQGGIDAAAEIMARQKGWKVRTFAELRVLEHRRTGTATARPLVARFKQGRHSYSLGYSLLFYGLRCLYRSLERPRIAGSAAALMGFLYGALTHAPVVLPQDTVDFLRAEQKGKLLRLVSCLR